MTWETVVGLEVHVQLATRSKMFCRCSSVFGDEPNTNVCPVCLGLPGALPVPNREAVRLALRAALGIGCTVHPESVFARKNYFYPDLPKGYQISQFDKPLATDGGIDIVSPERGSILIGVTRLHVEEDAGKSAHGRIAGKTAVDFNRSGVPLAEIVSEPDIRSPGEARAYLVALKQVLQYLEVSDCNMEEGHLRVDANVSVRPAGQERLGVKQEVKNMNSFAAVEKSLETLRGQQIQMLEDGGSIALATFTAGTGTLRMMRTKEESHDYRYFPEPDIPPLVLGEAWIAEELRQMPELPAAKRQRFEGEYGIPAADVNVLTSTGMLADYFEAVVSAGADGKSSANWIMGVVLQDVNENGGALRVAPLDLAKLIAMVKNGTVSQQAGKRVFAEVAQQGGEPQEAAERLGLIQVSDDDAIGTWVDNVLDQFGDEAARFREGETKLIGFFVGRVMKESRGKADPKTVQRLLRDRLE